jgi:hypothetical protein
MSKLKTSQLKPDLKTSESKKTELKNSQQSAIEAVAKHFSATSQSAEGAPDAYLMVRGQRIALDVAVLPQQSPRQTRVAKARLREDKVAQRVLRDLESALHAHVPAGRSVILTLGAPIKVANKLVVALADLLVTYLESGLIEVDEKRTILGNRVRFRVLRVTSKWPAKVIGFVFTGDPAPGVLATTITSLHDEIVAMAKRRSPKGFSGDRWLVLRSDNSIADGKTYRLAYSLLSPPHDFRKVLMVSDSGRLEVLAES